MTSNQNLEDTAVAVHFDAVREHVPITLECIDDSDGSVAHVLRERILTPIPEITRDVVFRSYDLTNVLTRNVEFRVIVDNPMLFVGRSDKQVRILLEVRKLIESNGLKIETGNFFDIITSEVGRNDVHMGVHNGILGLTDTGSATTIFPNQSALTIECKLEDVFNVRKDIVEFLNHFVREFTEGHHVLIRTNLEITECKLTRTREDEEVLRLVKRRFVVRALAVAMVATEAVRFLMTVRRARKTRAVRLVVADINTEIVSKALKLLGDIRKVGCDPRNVDVGCDAVGNAGAVNSDHDGGIRNLLRIVICCANIALVVSESVLTASLDARKRVPS